LDTRALRPLGRRSPTRISGTICRRTTFARGASAAKVFKGFGTAGALLAPLPDLHENLQKGASGAEFAADLTVDLGIAGGTLLATAGVLALASNPVGWLALAIGAGVAVGAWFATDVLTFNGATASQHAKNGLTGLFGG
jgi:hypothetical protein